MLTVDFDLLPIKGGEKALDAGCGTGRHSMEFLRRGVSLFSMDIDFDSLKAAQENLARVDTDNRKSIVHSGDALAMPFRDETFDRIICSEVMEHVDDENRACRELARILKQGGLIAITVPTTFSEIMYYLLTVEYFTSPGGHVRIFTPGKLAKIMRENNLIIYGMTFKHSFHTLWWGIRSVVGLHNEHHPLTRSYRSFLTLGLFSRLMRRMESFFDWFFPKSVVLYAIKKTEDCYDKKIDPLE